MAESRENSFFPQSYSDYVLGDPSDLDLDLELEAVIQNMPEILREIEESEAAVRCNPSPSNKPGFIGLGPSGLTFLWHLLEGYPNYQFVVFDRDPLNFDGVRNVEMAGSPAEVARECSLVFTRFFDVKCVQQVLAKFLFSNCQNSRSTSMKMASQLYQLCSKKALSKCRIWRHLNMSLSQAPSKQKVVSFWR
jgi:hypothetical protein